MSDLIPQLHHDRPVVTPSDVAFELAISWRDWQSSQHHYREIVRFRLDEEQGRAPSRPNPRDWIGVEQDVSEAMQLQRTMVEERIDQFHQLTAQQRSTLTPDRRLECQNILLVWERQQDLERLSEHQNQERGGRGDD